MEAQPETPNLETSSWHYNPEKDFLPAEESTVLQRLLSVEVFGNICSGEERFESCCMKQWVTKGAHDVFRKWVESFIGEHPGIDTITYADMEPAIAIWKEEFNPTVH